MTSLSKTNNFQTLENTVNTLSIEIPDEMYCPITGEIMNQPMISPRGHSYEKEAILRHLVEYAERSPMTNEPLQPHRLRENRGLKSAINTIIPFINKSQRFKQKCKIAQFTKEQHKISIDILKQIKLNSHYKDGKLYIKITVPNCNTRDPVDVVLCIDISGSMNNEATKLDKDGTRISHGLSLLDITRGGAISVIKCLQEYDRVSIVTYSNKAELVEDWTNLTEEGKLNLINKLKSLRTGGSTNLSDGITKSLDQFKKTGQELNRKNAAFVFTDGIPNIIPPKGHEYMIEQWRENNPNIGFLLNTLGFGYDLDDKLLKNISKIGGGEYDFIPDSAMLGDIMTHTISNVIVTLLQSAKICIQLSNGATFMDSDSVMGESLVNTTSWGKIIDINSLQYGQTRTKVVNITVPDRFKDDPSKCIETFLSFKDFNGNDQIIQSRFTFGNDIATCYKIDEIRYKLVDTINKCINILDNTDCVANNREILNVNDSVRADCGWNRFYKGTIIERHTDNTYDIKFDDGDYKYRVDITKIKPCNTANVEPIINSLLEYINIQPVIVKETSYIKDLVKDIKGQVTEALNISPNMKKGQDWYNRWGRKYLLSFIGSHNDERCNSSKDISLQHFTTKLFNDNFKMAENIYKTLPAPKPSLINRRPPQNSIRRPPPRSYASYDCSGPCFIGSSKVKMIDNSFIRVDRIVKGDKIFIGMAKMEPIEFATIKLVIKTKIISGKTNIVNINSDLGITPNHPIKINNSWTHPKNINKPRLQNCDYVYNFVLDTHHYMIIGKTKCCTLGHNFKGPIIEHDYFGTEKVIDDLKRCKGYNDGIVELYETDIIRDSNTGWVSGIDIMAQNSRIYQD